MTVSAFAMALMILTLVGHAQAQAILDFITFDDVHYLRWAEEPGLTIWFADGTTLGRPYFTETSELMDGLVVPTEFGSILERYLRD